MTATPDVDDRALDLRSQGQSFAKIAKELEMDRPSRAIDAFTRSLRRRPPDEQERLLAEELGRLDTLAARVRRSGELDAAEIERRLGAVERIRAMVLAAG